MQSQNKTWTRIVGIGAIAGLRATGGLSAISWTAAHGGYPALSRTPLSILASRQAAYVMGAGLVIESLADKVAPLPARTEPQGLISRAVPGALIGALVSMAEDAPFVRGVLLGSGVAMAIGAAAATIRRWATTQLGVPDALMGLIEDAFVIGGLALLQRADTSDTARS